MRERIMWHYSFEKFRGRHDRIFYDVRLWVLYSMDALMEQINKMDFVKAATTLGLLYGIFMVIYLLATYIIFNMNSV